MVGVACRASVSSADNVSLSNRGFCPQCIGGPNFGVPAANGLLKYCTGVKYGTGVMEVLITRETGVSRSERAVFAAGGCEKRSWGAIMGIVEAPRRLGLVVPNAKEAWPASRARFPGLDPRVLPAEAKTLATCWTP